MKSTTLARGNCLAHALWGLICIVCLDGLRPYEAPQSPIRAIRLLLVGPTTTAENWNVDTRTRWIAQAFLGRCTSMILHNVGSITYWRREVYTTFINSLYHERPKSIQCSWKYTHSLMCWALQSHVDSYEQIHQLRPYNFTTASILQAGIEGHYKTHHRLASCCIAGRGSVYFVELIIMEF